MTISGIPTPIPILAPVDKPESLPGDEVELDVDVDVEV